jgi:hypothetical protein
VSGEPHTNQTGRPEYNSQEALTGGSWPFKKKQKRPAGYGRPRDPLFVMPDIWSVWRTALQCLIGLLSRRRSLQNNPSWRQS